MGRRKKTVWVKRGVGRPMYRNRHQADRPVTTEPPSIPCTRSREPVPIETWRLRGFVAEEVTLPSDVAIPDSNDGRAMLRPGMRVIALRNHTGLYMQLDDGRTLRFAYRHNPTRIGGNVINDHEVGNAVPSRNSLSRVQDDDGRPMEGARPPIVNRTVDPLEGQRDLTKWQQPNQFVRPDDGAQDTVALGLSMPNTPNMTRQYLPFTLLDTFTIERISFLVFYFYIIILLLGIVLLLSSVREYTEI